MGARLCTTNRWITPIATYLLLLFLAGPQRSLAHDEWYRGLDLESALADSGLVLVVRVTDVSETKLGVGGKGERSLLQYKFEPVLVLKGVFSRQSSPGSFACSSWGVRSRDTRCVERLAASIKQYLRSVIPTTSCSRPSRSFLRSIIVRIALRKSPCFLTVSESKKALRPSRCSWQWSAARCSPRRPPAQWRALLRT